MASGEVLVLTKLSKLTKICRKIRSQVKGIPCNSFRDWAPPEIANETARGPEGPHGSPKCPWNPTSGAIVPMFGPLSCLGSHKCPRKGPQPPQPHDRDEQTRATSPWGSPSAQSPPRHWPPNYLKLITGGSDTGPATQYFPACDLILCPSVSQRHAYYYGTVW